MGLKAKKHTVTTSILLIISFLALAPVGGGQNKSGLATVCQEEVNDADRQVITNIFHQRHIEIMDSVMRIYRRSYRFNGAVMISEKGRMIYNKTFGYADIGKNEKLTTNHSFQLASVSKQFTAAAIMILAERGDMNISDSVIHFFPDFPYPEVTVEHLLHHTGGLPNYMWMYENRWDSTTIIPTNDTLMKMLADNKLGRYFRAGRNHDYSNTGYAVLACIVSEVSGKSFGEFLDDEIFIPLGMTHTFAWSQGNEKPGNKMTIPGYYRRGRRFYRVQPTLHDGILGDKGVFSNGEDMYKWDQALYNGTIISDSMLNLAFSSFKLRGRREIPYGYGFRIKDIDDKKVVYHNGLWEGFRLNFYRYLEDERTVFVMDHTNLSLTGVMARRFRKLMEPIEDFHETQVIVETAIDKGAHAAIELYFSMIDENPDLMINNDKIVDIAYYFSNKGKFTPANELKNLIDFFNNEYACENPNFYSLSLI